MNYALCPQKPISRKHCATPVTVLAVKDRGLAHNPLDVLYDSARLGQRRL